MDIITRTVQDIAVDIDVEALLLEATGESAAAQAAKADATADMVDYDYAGTRARHAAAMADLVQLPARV